MKHGGKGRRPNSRGRGPRPGAQSRAPLNEAWMRAHGRRNTGARLRQKVGRFQTVNASNLSYINRQAAVNGRMAFRSLEQLPPSAILYLPRQTQRRIFTSIGVPARRVSFALMMMALVASVGAGRSANPQVLNAVVGGIATQVADEIANEYNWGGPAVANALRFETARMVVGAETNAARVSNSANNTPPPKPPAVYKPMAPVTTSASQALSTAVGMGAAVVVAVAQNTRGRLAEIGTKCEEATKSKAEAVAELVAEKLAVPKLSNFKFRNRRTKLGGTMWNESAANYNAAQEKAFTSFKANREKEFTRISNQRKELEKEYPARCEAEIVARQSAIMQAIPAVAEAVGQQVATVASQGALNAATQARIEAESAARVANVEAKQRIATARANAEIATANAGRALTEAESRAAVANRAVKTAEAEARQAQQLLRKGKFSTNKNKQNAEAAARVAATRLKTAKAEAAAAAAKQKEAAKAEKTAAQYLAAAKAAEAKGALAPQLAEAELEAQKKFLASDGYWGRATAAAGGVKNAFMETQRNGLIALTMFTILGWRFGKDGLSLLKDIFTLKFRMVGRGFRILASGWRWSAASMVALAAMGASYGYAGMGWKPSSIVGVLILVGAKRVIINKLFPPRGMGGSGLPFRPSNSRPKAKTPSPPKAKTPSPPKPKAMPPPRRLSSPANSGGSVSSGRQSSPSSRSASQGGQAATTPNLENLLRKMGQLQLQHAAPGGAAARQRNAAAQRRAANAAARRQAANAAARQANRRRAAAIAAGPPAGRPAPSGRMASTSARNMTPAERAARRANLAHPLV